jgi:tryptophan 2,3-dioxygenase
MTITYASYLELDRLLELQRPLSEGPEHDEMLFIVIHQTYELWFKQILHEVDRLHELFAAGDTARAGHTLKRIRTILKTLVGQVDILETMTPLEFLAFRDRLETASGFQSFQFRELEFALGYKRPVLREQFPPGSNAARRLAARLDRPSLWDAFVALLGAAGHPVPAPDPARDPGAPTRPSPPLQAALIEVYRRDPVLAGLCELMVDVDEGLQEWRYRHVKMVERTIGDQPGTGGSSGVRYLRQTLFSPCFPDLWAIRSTFAGRS